MPRCVRGSRVGPASTESFAEQDRGASQQPEVGHPFTTAGGLRLRLRVGWFAAPQGFKGRMQFQTYSKFFSTLLVRAQLCEMVGLHCRHHGAYVQIQPGMLPTKHLIG